MTTNRYPLATRIIRVPAYYVLPVSSSRVSGVHASTYAIIHYKQKMPPEVLKMSNLQQLLARSGTKAQFSEYAVRTPLNREWFSVHKARQKRKKKLEAPRNSSFCCTKGSQDCSSCLSLRVLRKLRRLRNQDLFSSQQQPLVDQCSHKTHPRPQS